MRPLIRVESLPECIYQSLGVCAACEDTHLPSTGANARQRIHTGCEPPGLSLKLPQWGARREAGLSRSIGSNMSKEVDSICKGAAGLENGTHAQLQLPPAPPEETGAVKAWHEPVIMRSYLPAPPDTNP